MDSEGGPPLIFRYFPELSDTQKHQISLLGTFFQRWNSRVNLISRKDLDNLYERHVLHSLAIARYVSFPADREVLDAGTGGGFPGIPLAIVFPEAHFVLVDSVGKKLHIVERLARELDLHNVETVHERVEHLTGSYHYVVGRAVSALPQYCAWVADRLRRPADGGGILYLKGGDVEEELKALPFRSKVVDLINYFDRPFFGSKKLVHLF